jgi:hypothetical protein
MMPEFTKTWHESTLQEYEVELKLMLGFGCLFILVYSAWSCSKSYEVEFEILQGGEPELN